MYLLQKLSMKSLFLLFAGITFNLYYLSAQTTIALWDFNTGNDNSVSTGTTLPANGSGTISLIGGTTNNFATGHSSDPNSTDNSGFNTSNYPAQNTNPKTSGIQIIVSTVGLDDIQIAFLATFK